MAWYEYPRYVSAAERRKKAEKAAERLRKKEPEMHPVVIRGSKLATTWWGKAWNDNLERYSDYENRIGRGRSYVRSGAVIDLRIGPGRITALVQGSRPHPYRVEIGIKPLPTKVWESIKKTCAGRIESLGELVEGRFPKDLADLFTAKGSGLFPAPEEISFACSCPDWAYMCKHVAAVLYGVGARLDEDPTLFFTLRGVGIEELVTEAVQEKTRAMLDKAEKRSRRILADADIAEMFGVEVEMNASEKPRKRRGKAQRETDD